MNIYIHNQQSDLPFHEEAVQQLFQELLNWKKVNTDEVDLYFVDQKTISEIHELAFEDPSPTDCITFPMDPLDSLEKPHYLGEAFICPAVALQYAQEENLSPYEELSLYIVHCFLHFLGFEDHEEEKKKLMRLEEEKCIAHLKKHGLLLKEGLSIE